MGTTFKQLKGDGLMKLQLVKFFFILMALTAVSGCSPTTESNAENGELPAYRYDNHDDPADLDVSMAAYRAISRWSKKTISYAFVNNTNALPGDREHELVRQAFAIWAEHVPLTFVETADNGRADIEIGWFSGSHGGDENFDGPGGILAYANIPNPYGERQLVLRFDNDESWSENPSRRQVDMLTVAIHEIGHCLGLDHSSDRDAVMFASYDGEHGFLDNDDVAGVQSLYGVRETASPPQTPPDNASPPSSNTIDSDNDGLSDTVEKLRVGTDPNNPDTDGDGVGDGIEVRYLMNPLDPDMDKDGVNDGDELRAGTDPFTPDYEETEADQEIWDAVSEFLGEAITTEIDVFAKGDTASATRIFAGPVLQNLEAQIADLNNRGLMQAAEFDYYNSYINDVRVVNNGRVDVDTCEVWYTAVYQRSNGALVDSSGPDLLPQTLTLENLGNGWYVTAVDFHDAPSFCN